MKRMTRHGAPGASCTLHLRSAPIAVVALAAIALALGGCATDAPTARVYARDPIGGTAGLVQVALPRLDDPEGTLNGRYARVWHCEQAEQGRRVQLTLAGARLDGQLCTEVQRLRPRGGSYDHVGVPSELDGEHPMAALMAYVHVDRARAYLAALAAPGAPVQDPAPLDVIVNFQGRLDLSRAWVGVPNAAYAPAGSAEELKAIIDIDPFGDRDVLAFGYNNLLPQLPQGNFAYDATVIAHEVVHAAIGGARLQHAIPDVEGLDTTPRAVNEGLADFFASCIHDTPIIGRYALGEARRDLSRVKRCPDDLVGQSHADGQILSSALYALRAKLGAVVERATWRAVRRFESTTGLSRAATLILEELRGLADTASADTARTLFTARGLPDCARRRAHRDLDTAGDALRSFELPSLPERFPGGTPSTVQYGLSLAQTTRALRFTVVAGCGGAMGLGGEAAAIALALRASADPITWQHGARTSRSNAELVIDGQTSAASVELVVAGPCLERHPELTFQLLNRGAAPAQVARLRVEQLQTVPAEAITWRDCP